ncbi:MAG: hypothetical protein RMK45_04160 [Armatimonadota bacterium]|nr:hypothetical protein [Armatimonadota bacterium]
MKTQDGCCAVEATLKDLSRYAADAPLLALGQTIFWDEPMKLTLLPWLQRIDPARRLLFGVHDTDYFARLHTRTLPQNAQRFGNYAMLPHNDGTTRTLWAAAGEIAQLFGSETVPTLKMYAQYGGAVERVAEVCPKGSPSTYIDALTEAWGWRGLVSLDSAPRPVCEVPLREVFPALDALLEFGLDGSWRMLEDSEARTHACNWAWALRQRVQQYADAHPEASLADAYLALYPELLRMLGEGTLPETVGFTRTTELLRFNTRTAHLPRFRLVDAFLNPATRRACEDAYNAAVAGSPIYPLSAFGEGALPFDLLIPTVGRGTILLTERYLVVLTPEPQIVRTHTPVRSVHQLAHVVETTWGNRCTLVGKALTLITMLAHEFVFVFNERGSPYLERTKAMNHYLREAGISLEVYPLLRLQYPTWDALQMAKRVRLRLPEHLACAFGEPSVCSDTFARRWRAVVAEQHALLTRLREMHSPRAVMQLLTEREGSHWQARLREYEQLHARLTQTVGEWAATLREQAHALHAERRALIREIQRNPQQFKALEPRLRELKQRIKRLNAERLRVASAPEARALQQRAHQLECEAERAKLRLLRCAYLTAEGLPYAHARPAAWWLAMVSPEWFRACAEGLQARIEPL